MRRKSVEGTVDGLEGVKTQIDELSAAIDAHVHGLRRAFDERFEAGEARFDASDEHFRAIDARFDTADEHFRAIDARFDGIDERLDAIDARFDGIDKRLDAIDRQLALIVTLLQER